MSKITLLLSKIIPHRFERKIRNFRDFYLRSYKIETLPKDIYSKDLEKYSISFCTTCRNRLYHLKNTIEKNIKSNSDYDNVEFVLINYNSQDGMHEWVKKHLMKYIEIGVLNYYYTEEPRFFHASKAKNLAHKLAKNEIVCNLDGDNFTGKDFAFYINYVFNIHGEDNVFQFKKAPYWGTEGRIALMKKYFVKLGGYDEAFHPTGHQDHDLIHRAEGIGLTHQIVEIENFLRYLSNSTVEKSSGLGEGDTNYYRLRDENIEKSKRNLESGQFVANTENGWGKTTVYKNFQPEPIRLS